MIAKHGGVCAALAGNLPARGDTYSFGFDDRRRDRSVGRGCGHRLAGA